jgi:hypothetical protein
MAGKSDKMTAHVLACGAMMTGGPWTVAGTGHTGRPAVRDKG